MRGRQRKYSLILNKSVNVPITTYLTWPDPNLCCGNLSLWPGHMNLNSSAVLTAKCWSQAACTTVLALSRVCITRCLFSLFLKVWSVLLKLQNSRKFIYTGAMLTTSTEQIPDAAALCWLQRLIAPTLTCKTIAGHYCVPANTIISVLKRTPRSFCFCAVPLSYWCTISG